MTDETPDDTDLAEPGGKVRLFIEDGLAAGDAVTLTEGQAHYLRHVMRAKSGEAVRLFNGRDGEWRAALALAGKRGAAAVPERQTRDQTVASDLWLCFAPVKKAPAEFIAQKATELGVSALRPIITRRTIVSRVNVERMRANAIEAAEQSDRLDVPDCHDPASLPWLLTAWPSHRALLFCDEAGAPPILDALKAAPMGPWGILIGPEGGFDAEERAAIRALPQCVPATLGSRILRADTAGLAALAIWQAALGS
ncbi:Ribosomal RNA small subunit methyltransferase E [Alphaproteobacteria bacterium SO-S41]|nr:Ribosomal RNA small subunit methyltransferase E [Alphaproteobacteria bacterium SO-S41]